MGPAILHNQVAFSDILQLDRLHHTATGFRTGLDGGGRGRETEVQILIQGVDLLAYQQVAEIQAVDTQLEVGHHIMARFAGLPPEDIGTRTAAHAVVAQAAKEDVVAAVADQGVVAAIAKDVVLATVSDEAVDTGIAGFCPLDALAVRVDSHVDGAADGIAVAIRTGHRQAEGDRVEIGGLTEGELTELEAGGSAIGADDAVGRFDPLDFHRIERLRLTELIDADDLEGPAVAQVVENHPLAILGDMVGVVLHVAVSVVDDDFTHQQHQLCCRRAAYQRRVGVCLAAGRVVDAQLEVRIFAATADHQLLPEGEGLLIAAKAITFVIVLRVDAQAGDQVIADDLTVGHFVALAHPQFVGVTVDRTGIATPRHDFRRNQHVRAAIGVGYLIDRKSTRLNSS